MTTIKSFNEACRESTCQKRITVCEIYDRSYDLLVRESNRFDPKGGTCHRLAIKSVCDDYPEESECGWTHAERMAIHAYKTANMSGAYRAVVYGHEFCCPPCEGALADIGVQILVIDMKTKTGEPSL